MTLDSKALAKICVASNMHKRCPAPCTADAILAGGTIRPLRNDRQNGDVIYTKLINIIYIYYIYTSSTAQGGGGSFKNGKPIGEVSWCDAKMAERPHWWIERWLSVCPFLSLFLSFSLCLSFAIYLQSYLSSHLAIYLSIHVSIYRPPVFNTFYFQMCFAPQRRTLFRHLNVQKCSETDSF